MNVHMMRVRLLDGTVQEAKLRPVTQVAYERHFKQSLSRLAESDAVVTGSLWLTWHALHAGKANVPEFETWIESVDEIMMDDEVEADPLGASPSLGGSLQPPSSPAQD